MSTMKDSPSSQPFPLAQLLIVGLCRCSQPFAIASLLPYLPSYLESLSIPTVSVATYQGALLATLGICESTFAVPWTRLADRFGRKPVIVSTLIAQLLGNLCLGFCTTPWQAFACMVVIGIANGNVAVMRTCVAEMVTAKEHQARAFGFTPMASAGGTLLGSLSGGWLSGVRLGGGWPMFLLPSLISAAVFLPGIGFAMGGLEETGRIKLGYAKVPINSPHSSEDLDSDDDDSIELDATTKEDLELELDTENQSPTPQTNRLTILHNPYIWLNALTALHSVGSDNMLPLLLQYPAARPTPTTNISTTLFHSAYGFGTTARFTGALYALACASAMGVSSFIYPRLAKNLSHGKILSYALAAYPAIYFAFPLTLLPTSQGLSLVALTALFLLKGGIFICALQASMILLSNSVEKESLALAHGVNFTAGGLGRGVGSALVGGLFEWGFKVGMVVVPFWGLAAVGAAVAVGAWVRGVR